MNQEYDNRKMVEKLLLDLKSNEEKTRVKAARKLGEINIGEQQIAKVIRELQYVVDKDAYKLAKDFARNSIHRITEPELAQKERQERQDKIASKENEHFVAKSTSHYPALRTLATVYGFIGWIVLGCGVLGGIGFAISFGNDSFVLAVVIFASVLVGSIVTAMLLFAAYELVDLLISQAADNRMSKEYLKQLVEFMGNSKEG